MKTIIYHNPRCSKSREALCMLEEQGENVEIVKYLDDVPSIKQLEDLIKMLGIKPIQLVRINEAIWKEKYKGKELSDAEVIQAMHENPRLIERPIVVKDGKASIGRPPSLILDIL